MDYRLQSDIYLLHIFAQVGQASQVDLGLYNHWDHDLLPPEAQLSAEKNKPFSFNNLTSTYTYTREIICQTLVTLKVIYLFSQGNQVFRTYSYIPYYESLIT